MNDPNAAPEIFAYGLRNPWRIDFDSAGNLYVANAGQELYEEINIVTAGGNYQGRSALLPPRHGGQSSGRVPLDGREWGAVRRSGAGV